MFQSFWHSRLNFGDTELKLISIFPIIPIPLINHQISGLKCEAFLCWTYMTKRASIQTFSMKV